MKRRILILYTSHTLGHKSIAENIGYHSSKLGYEVRLEDILKVQKGALVTVGEWFHTFINVHFPFIWKWMYTNKTFIKLTLPWRSLVAGMNSSRASRLIEEWCPDLVITTQTSASAVVNYLRSKNIYKGKFAIAFSDYHFHPFWAYSFADAYLVNIVEQQVELERLGVNKDSVFVCGIALKDKLSLDSKQIKNRLGIQSGSKVILIGSGSLGIGLPTNLLEELLLLENIELENGKVQIHLIFATGRNKDLAEYLRRKTKTQGNVSVLEFYAPMEELYSISDIFVSKPGGLSVAEALRENLPIFVTHYLPGQEELNIEYLKKAGLVSLSHSSDTEKLIRLIKNELRTGDLKKGLLASGVMGLIAHKDSGLASVKEALEFLFHEKTP